MPHQVPFKGRLGRIARFEGRNIFGNLILTWLHKAGRAGELSQIILPVCILGQVLVVHLFGGFFPFPLPFPFPVPEGFPPLPLPLPEPFPFPFGLPFPVMLIFVPLTFPTPLLFTPLPGATGFVPFPLLSVPAAA